MSDKAEANQDEMTTLFQCFVPDTSALITFDILKKVTTELGAKISDEELKDMITEGDKDHKKGGVSFEDFIELLKRAEKVKTPNKTSSFKK